MDKVALAEADRLQEAAALAVVALAEAVAVVDLDPAD
jgi:hypothetical protein